MKNIFYIVVAGVLLSLTSCTMTDVDVSTNFTPSANSGLKLIGAAEDFDVKDVNTRADEEVSDSHISEMTMLIYKADGNMLPAVDAEGNPLPSSHINIRKPNPTFLIEANKYDGTGILASMEAGVVTKYYDNKATDLGACKIYIVANAYHLIGERLEAGELNTIAKLNAAIVDTEASLAMPIDEDGNYIGLPMMGCAWEEGVYVDGKRKDKTFNLQYKGDNESSNSVATIPLKTLYSKIRFTMQVNSNQYVSGQTPQFTLTDVEVFNIPAQVRMDYQEGNYVDNYPDGGYLYTGTEGDPAFSLKGTSLWPSRTTTKHDSSELLEFYFFMPEHKVTPFYTRENYPNYPNNLPKDRQQYYKPKLVAPTSVGGITQAKVASFVRIHGNYTNHNGQINAVSYDIYLGQNEVDDFEVKRNQQLNNILTITGLTNHKDAYGGESEDKDGDGKPDGNISIDHRVTMTNTGFLLSMEREAILDSHFEVRPLDVTLSPGGKMTIVIPDTYKSWLAMESDAAAYTGTNSPYVSDSDRKGVRKYFTTDLVGELNGTNGGTVTVAHSGANPNKTEIHRIWFYIDENPNVYDKTLPGQDGSGNTIDYSTNNATDSFGITYNISKNLYRLGKVNFFYSGDGTDPDTSSTPTTVVNMQQWNLWRVWSAPNENGVRERYYDIEHEEEYLNNYASDVQYGPAKDDGMVYGLENVQLSDSEQSIVASQSGYSLGTIFNSFFTSITDMANTALNNVAKYDFYLPRDFEDIILTTEQQSSLTIREYSGRAFNEEIAATLKANYPTHQIESYKPEDYPAQIDKLYLTQDPQSAFAYCYHKNKRNDNGVVENQKWYLPAIDEIEDIAAGAYDEFDQVFQNKKYWSCQPAYNKESLKAKIVTKLELGEAYLLADYYVDNIKRARATSIVITIENGKQKPNNIPSHTPGYSGKREGNANGIYSSWHDVTLDGFSFDVPRTDIPISDEEYAKVPGNLPRTTNCRIRAVYRSGTK